MGSGLGVGIHGKYLPEDCDILLLVTGLLFLFNLRNILFKISFIVPELVYYKISATN